MKILHYVDENRLSWAVPWLQLLLRHRELGDENVVACRPGGTLGARLAGEGFEVAFYRPSFPFLPQLCRGFSKVLEKTAPDLVHTRLSTAASIAGYWGPKAGIPVVSTVDKFPKPRYYERSSLLLACSGAVARHMEEGGIPGEKLKVVPNGIDTAFYGPCRETRETLRRQKGVKPETIVVLAAGRLVDWKGFDVLLEAFALSRPESAVLWIVGEGPEKTRLEQKIDDLALRGVAVMHPFASDLRPFFWASDLFILPSRTPEPFGLVLLEAMASGLPVIATDAGGPREIVNKEAGWLVRPDNPASLAKSLHEALDDGEMLAAAGRAAMDRSRAFDVAGVARGTRSIYLSLLGGRKGER